MNISPVSIYSVQNSSNNNLKSPSFGHLLAESCNIPHIAYGALNHNTNFFRDMIDIRAIRTYVDKVFKDKNALNIFTGACSTGEETWTVLMSLFDLAKKINITGFDISPKAVDCANGGCYKALRHDVSPHLGVFNQFFDASAPGETFLFNTYSVKPEKKDLCKFVVGDLFKLEETIPEAGADVLTFRNALYHFTTINHLMPVPNDKLAPILRKIFGGVNKALSENGIFVLGDHRNIGSVEQMRTVIPKTLEEAGFAPVGWLQKVTGCENIWGKSKNVSGPA